MITNEQIEQKFLAGTYQNENQFASAAYTFAWNRWPQLRRLLFHVKNELDRVPGESGQNYNARLALAAAMGVVPGVPDQICMFNQVCGIELKVPGGSVSPAQRKIHELWYQSGRVVYLAWLPAEYIDILLHLATQQPVPDKYISPYCFTHKLK